MEKTKTKTKSHFKNIFIGIICSLLAFTLINLLIINISIYQYIFLEICFVMCRKLHILAQE